MWEFVSAVVLNADSNVSHCAMRFEVRDMYAFQVSGSLLI